MEKRVLLSVCLLVAVSAFSGVLYQTGEVPTDETVTRIEVGAEGDAVFVLRVITVLDSDEKREAFDSFTTEVENDSEASASDFRGSVEPLVERAGEEIGREMSASNFTVETRTEPLPEERGIVEYRFVWGGFAATSDDELRAGDVLSGYILSDGDMLVLDAPDGYTVSSAEPTPDRTGEEARWNGPYDFGDDEPRVVFVPEAAEPNSTDSDSEEADRIGETDGEDGQGAVTDGGDGDGTDTPETDGMGVPLYAYAVALVVVISVAAVVYHARIDEEASPAEEERAQEAAEQEAAEEPESDDERVLGMIESEGGRMKQKHVVEETGWSEAKVSKLTSRMEDEGDITKIRLGRENILELSDDEDEKDEENERSPV